MSTKNKLLNVTLLLVIAVVIATYICWVFGYQGFYLLGTVVLPNFITYIVYGILFYIGFAIWAGIALNEYSIKLVYLTLPYMIIYCICSTYFSPTLITSSVIPFLYIVGLGIMRNDWKNVSIRGMKYFLIIFIYQILALLVKTNVLNLDQFGWTIYQHLAFGIDLIILEIILFIYGGELYSVQNFREKFLGWSKQHWSSSREELISESCVETNKLRQEFDALRSWQKKLTVLIYLGIQVVQCAFVLWVCTFFGNPFLQTFLIMLSFIPHGLILHKRWHSKSIIVCTLVSSALFFACSKLTPSVYIFQLLPIISGLLLAYVLYKIELLREKKTFEKWYNSITNLTVGKYSKVGNHKEVALAKGLTESDLMFVGYDYQISDDFSKWIGQISPWNNGEYVRNEDSSE